MKKRKPRLQRYSCAFADTDEVKRVLAADHLQAAEKYWRGEFEDLPESELNCIGEVEVLCPDGTVYSVTVQSELVLDVEAVRCKKR